MNGLVDRALIYAEIFSRLGLTKAHCIIFQGYAIKQKEHPMQQFAIAGAASVRPFNPILSVQHSRKNILTGADFKQPRVKSLLDRLVEFLNQKVQP